MRRAPLVALGALACAACSPEPPGSTGSAGPAAAVFALRAVVAPALAALGPEEPAASVDTALEGEELEELLGGLRSLHAEMRTLAIEDAVSRGPRAVPGLARTLADENEGDVGRLGSAHALGAFATREAAEALFACASSNAPSWLRAQCFHQLGVVNRDELVPRLLLRLKYEKEHEVVYWLADALARLGNLAGIDALLNLWSTTDRADLRDYAAYRLNELAVEHGASTADELRTRRDAGEVSSARVPSPELVRDGWHWIERLGNYDLRSVDDARFVLVRLEPWIVPMLAETLHETDVHVRLHAAQCLARRGPRARAALDELVAALTDERIGPAAAEALGALGDPTAAAALEPLLGTSPDPELRVAAARALGALGETSLLAVLRAAFAEPEAYDLRQAAAESLLAIEPGPETLAFLVACLEDPRADAGAAEVALGRWIERRAKASKAHADSRDRWRALEPEPGRIHDAAQQAERRRARAEICRTLAP